MKKAYKSPKFSKVMFESDVILTSTLAYDLGEGDWGVPDEL